MIVTAQTEDTRCGMGHTAVQGWIEISGVWNQEVISFQYEDTCPQFETRFVADPSIFLHLPTGDFV